MYALLRQYLKSISVTRAEPGMPWLPWTHRCGRTVKEPRVFVSHLERLPYDLDCVRCYSVRSLKIQLQHLNAF
jgi:hypothetical protein